MREVEAVEAVVEADVGVGISNTEATEEGGEVKVGGGGYRKINNIRGVFFKGETKEMNGNVFQTHSEQKKRG